MTESASKAQALVEQVNSGNQEQAQGIEQITKTMVQMEQVTQTTAGNANESAAAGEQLNAQSQALRNTVGRLKARVQG